MYKYGCVGSHCVVARSVEDCSCANYSLEYILWVELSELSYFPIEVLAGTLPQAHVGGEYGQGTDRASSQLRVQSDLSVSTDWTLFGTCYGLDTVQARDHGEVEVRKSENLGIWESPVAHHCGRTFSCLEGLEVFDPVCLAPMSAWWGYVRVQFSTRAVTWGNYDGGTTWRWKSLTI